MDAGYWMCPVLAEYMEYSARALMEMCIMISSNSGGSLIELVDPCAGEVVREVALAAFRQNRYSLERERDDLERTIKFWKGEVKKCETAFGKLKGFARTGTKGREIQQRLAAARAEVSEREHKSTVCEENIRARDRRQRQN